MPELPEKIEKYQIISVLGKGAMGIVYHAYDPMVKRDVAIKFLSSLGSEETELISRFEREARLAGGLRHPNIVTIYDLGHFEGRPYIVMEYILGRDLQTVIRQKQELTFEQRVEIILQICKGLEAAHQKGIIHRDIKPANIRLQEDNTVKIMDFGIARMGTSELTRSGYIIGTLQYMSPEQISGEQLDPRTDIFSTGVIAYELFTYNNPFNGEHTVDIMYRILNVRPQAIRELPEEYGTELNEIILRALEKNRELRYPSAREMAQELEEYLFYLKSLKFQRKQQPRVTAYTEGITQAIPLETVQAPSSSAKDVSSAPVSSSSVPSNVTPDLQNLPTAFNVPTPTFGTTEPTRAPRTGLGANYSETAQQILMKETSLWQEKKFFILGAIVSLLFIGGIILTANLSKQSSSTLTIQSTPAGADIWIDGKKSLQTPATIEGKKDVTLTFRKGGYQDKVVSLSKDIWPKELTIRLDPEPSKPAVVGRNIKIDSTPPGAALLFDGQDAGKTPAQVKIPDDQPHEIQLQLEGYQTIRQPIDKNSPETITVQLQTTAAPGLVKYTSAHPVAVFVEGKAVKGNPLELEPGTYTLAFRSRKEAYIRFTQTVEVKSGETVALKVPPKGMGSLSVKANPSNCRISIDGEFIDTAPIFNLPVQAGSHTIQFYWEKLGKKLSKPVVISAGESDTVTAVPES
jgi:serine/threonine protein kinase